MIGIAFDLEGTIVDVEAAHHQGHLATARELGLSLSYDEAIAEIPAFIGGPDSAIAAEFHRRSDAAWSIDAITARMKDHYLTLLETMTIAPRPGFLGFFKHVQRRGLWTAIGSLTPQIEALRLLRAAGIDQLFDVMVFAEDVSALKPAPDVYLATAARMGIAPVDQLVIEDSARGVQAAVAAGSRVIAIPTIHTAEFTDRVQRAGAAAVYQHWSEVVL